MTFYHRRGLRGFSSLPASCCGAPGSNIGRRSGGNIPCRGVPQTAQASAFKVISAPQHAQNAAIIIYSLELLLPIGRSWQPRRFTKENFALPSGFLRPGEAHALDDKGRMITHLEVRESDGTEELPIRLANLKVSNNSPLVIPSAAEGSAVRLART